MRIFDAHMHYDKGSVQHIRELFDSHDLAGATVILNKEEDFLAFEQNCEMLPEGKVRYAAIIEPGTTALSEFVDKWSSYNMALKIHPRLSGLTVSDIPNILNMVGETGSNVVIVDCMGYGHQYNSHIGIEIGIELALEFPTRNIVFAHAGGERLMECFLYTRTLENAYYDISLVSTYFKGTHVYDDLCHFMRYNTDKIMFGSDYPDFDPVYCEEEVLKLCRMAGLNEEMTEKIFFDNAMRIYGKTGG